MPQEPKDQNFGDFLDAVAAVTGDEGEMSPMRVTAHSSSVATEDWSKLEKIQDAETEAS